jgi:hypothetical protein
MRRGVGSVGQHATLSELAYRHRWYWIRLVGGILLLGIGFGTLRWCRPAEKAIPAPPRHAWTVISTAMLVFTNPLTLFGFAAAFAMIGIQDIVVHRLSVLVLVAGVFFGSSCLRGWCTVSATG